MSSRRAEDPPSTFEVTFSEVSAGSIYTEVHPPRASPGQHLLSRLSEGRLFFQLFAIYRSRGEDKTEVVAAEFVDFEKGLYWIIETELFLRSNIEMPQGSRAIKKKESPFSWFDIPPSAVRNAPFSICECWRGSTFAFLAKQQSGKLRGSGMIDLPRTPPGPNPSISPRIETKAAATSTGHRQFFTRGEIKLKKYSF